jgi:hypothetical protein
MHDSSKISAIEVTRAPRNGVAARQASFAGNAAAATAPLRESLLHRLGEAGL